ncbi:MAG: 50S ribosomal protein L25 [Planctomycetes bacterium]|nr:50S ribosomal protein L25 [Planctomycetota bacterium]
MVAELKAVKREALGSRKVNKLRMQGLVPAVVYGEGKIGLALAISEREFGHLLHSGDRVVVLKIEGEADKQALIKGLQFDALGELVLHVDFNELRAGQTVRVNIPVAVKGTAKGAADGGVVNLVIHEIEVECLPTAIPDKIVVDVSSLELNTALHLREIPFPEGVKPVDDPEEVVVQCEPPRKEEDLTTAAAPSATEPEVINEKKVEAPEGEAKDAKGGKPAGGDKEKKDKK